MLQHPIHGCVWASIKRGILCCLPVCVLVLMLSACGVTTTGNTGSLGGSTASTPTNTVAPTVAPIEVSTPTAASFSVTSVGLSVNPTSIAGVSCGSVASFTYTATFHIPAHTAGGTITFAYTLNNGRSQTPGTVTVGADETSKTFTFNSSDTLAADHTSPGVAIVMVTSPNSLISPSAQPSGACV